jgi:hypothetical protein
MKAANVPSRAGLRPAPGKSPEFSRVRHDLGLMSFVTDYPDVTMRELKTYYAKRKDGK